jgi:hypothetical protein
MFGTDVIVIDPENEYQALCEAVGGSFFDFSLNSDKRVNPFDLPQTSEDESGDVVLRTAVTDLKGLLALMVGGITPEEDAILDKAIYDTYALRDITADASTHQNTPPVLSDLQGVLQNTKGAESLARRLTKYTEGTFAGLFNQPTNFELSRGFIVFSIRNLEEALRPLAMYSILNYIWAQIRHQIRKRLLVVDEAWVLMQYPDSAKYLYSLAKRARKYFLGLTIISQDVEDFLGSEQGRAVLNNSSLQILLKQSPAAVEKLVGVFHLTEGEKFLLLESDVGEGLFFAGSSHVAIKVVASYAEDQIITTDPRQLLEQREEEEKEEDISGAAIEADSPAEAPAEVKQPESASRWQADLPDSARRWQAGVGQPSAVGQIPTGQRRQGQPAVSSTPAAAQIQQAPAAQTPTPVAAPTQSAPPAQTPPPQAAPAPASTPPAATTQPNSQSVPINIQKNG